MKCAPAVLTIFGLTSPAVAVTLRGAANSSTVPVEEQCSQYATMATFQGAAPDHCQTKHCMPQCRYQCSDPSCEQECTPECLAPECQTRCPSLKGTSMYAAGCKITCVKPQCEVVCPERHCGADGCAECKTVCQTPKCSVVCPDAGCQEVCKEPKCKFNCAASKEKCAEPECKMSCEQSSCSGVEDGLPPLAEGMVVVDAVSPESLNTGKGFSSKSGAPSAAPAAAPAALMQTGARMVSMEVKTVVDGKLVSSTVDLPM